MKIDYGVLIAFLSGAVCLLSLVVAWLFYKAWWRSRDWLFYYFAAAFALLALERLLLTFTDPAMEVRPLFYIIRLVAFLTIICGIWKKNSDPIGR